MRTSLVFYNVDYFRERVRAAIAAAETPVQWLVIDASSINVVDITAVQKFDELREELAGQGIKLVSARVKQNLLKYFKPAWGGRTHGNQCKLSL